MSADLAPLRTGQHRAARPGTARAGYQASCRDWGTSHPRRPRACPWCHAAAAAVLRLVELASQGRGCLILLDDLQDSDAESLAVVEYLVDNIERQSTLAGVTWCAPIQDRGIRAGLSGGTAWHRRTARAAQAHPRGGAPTGGLLPRVHSGRGARRGRRAGVDGQRGHPAARRGTAHRDGPRPAADPGRRARRRLAGHRPAAHPRHRDAHPHPHRPTRPRRGAGQKTASARRRARPALPARRAPDGQRTGQPRASQPSGHVEQIAQPASPRTRRRPRTGTRSSIRWSPRPCSPS